MKDYQDTKPLPELGNDAYKDVLASLSELDATGSIDIDYLEANKTRTFNFSTDISKLDILEEPTSPKTFPKDNFSKMIYGILLALIFILLIIMASRL